MARHRDLNTFRRIKVSAEVESVTPTDSYSDDEVVLATLQTQIRLGGRFDRESVAVLVTNIVNQLVDAFDEPETTLAVLPDSEDERPVELI